MHQGTASHGAWCRREQLREQLVRRARENFIQPIVETYPGICAGMLVVGLNARPIYTPCASADDLGATLTIVQADPNNTGDVLVGNAFNHVFVLQPGEMITIPVDPSIVQVRGSTDGQTVNWGGSMFSAPVDRYLYGYEGGYEEGY